MGARTICNIKSYCLLIFMRFTIECVSSGVTEEAIHVDFRFVFALEAKNVHRLSAVCSFVCSLD